MAKFLFTKEGVEELVRHGVRHEVKHLDDGNFFVWLPDTEPIPDAWPKTSRFTSRALPRAEGPWWRSWLAVFGIENGLDRLAQMYSLKRRRRWRLFRESNRSLRRRCLEVARGM